MSRLFSKKKASQLSFLLLRLMGDANTGMFLCKIPCSKLLFEMFCEDLQGYSEFDAEVKKLVMILLLRVQVEKCCFDLEIGFEIIWCCVSTNFV